ncbi:alkaline phosphatase PhoX [Spirillospora sp. NPDC029432]|uniref:alkaline phosphatase PhoX n=1 Tax=Spirillospora sp. NPDC029432 TaxID=3154599 RepID=UPI0034524B32
MSVPRRRFLAGSGLAIAFTGSLDALFRPAAAGAGPGEAHGYGPLVPDPDGLLDLPEGFSYRTISPQGSPIGDTVVPGAHDGMAVFRGRRHGTWRLVRNHEQRGPDGRVAAPPELTYDPAAHGGTTTMEVSRDGELLGHHISLGGTFANCAGGTTPWGTWLTCEETEGFDGETRSHGWVFEIDPEDPRRNADPVPLKGLGRFWHEAVAIDPASRICYLTEDAKAPFGLLYRFLPDVTAKRYGAYRAGGLLQAMHVPGLPDLSLVQEAGTRFRNVRWVDVPDPEAASESTRMQVDPVTRGEKLEGAWWGRNSAYFVTSFARAANGSPAEHAGQVWRYDPRLRTLELELVFKPGGRYDSPDNITVSPYGGGVVLAEDGDGEIFLVGVTREGRPFALARNALNDSEMAGVAFSPDGRTLFANRYTPGVTFAITGPWHRLRR